MRPGEIVAIGGGEISTKPAETLDIDRELVGLVRARNPRLLFIPTASSDSESYVANVERHFGDTLGCDVSVLRLLDGGTSDEEAAEMILGSDIVYVGGGNTAMMLEVWRRSGVDSALREAHGSGVVLAGLSAGAICWFREGLSDSPHFSDASDSSLIRVPALGLIDMLVCPHYDAEENRRPSLEAMAPQLTTSALALDNCSAVFIEGENYRIVTSNPSAKARILRYDGELACDDVPQCGLLSDLI